MESASNQIPPKNEPREITIEHNPGAVFSLKRVPKRSPNPINISDEGITAATDKRSPIGEIPVDVISEITNVTI